MCVTSVVQKPLYNPLTFIRLYIVYLTYSRILLHLSSCTSRILQQKMIAYIRLSIVYLTYNRKNILVFISLTAEQNTRIFIMLYTVYFTYNRILSHLLGWVSVLVSFTYHNYNQARYKTNKGHTGQVEMNHVSTDKCSYIHCWQLLYTQILGQLSCFLK